MNTEMQEKKPKTRDPVAHDIMFSYFYFFC